MQILIEIMQCYGAQLVIVLSQCKLDVSEGVSETGDLSFKVGEGFRKVAV